MYLFNNFVLNICIRRLISLSYRCNFICDFILLIYLINLCRQLFVYLVQLHVYIFFYKFQNIYPSLLYVITIANVKTYTMKCYFKMDRNLTVYGFCCCISDIYGKVVSLRGNNSLSTRICELCILFLHGYKKRRDILGTHSKYIIVTFNSVGAKVQA